MWLEILCLTNSEYTHTAWAFTIQSDGLITSDLVHYISCEVCCYSHEIWDFVFDKFRVYSHNFSFHYSVWWLDHEWSGPVYFLRGLLLFSCNWRFCVWHIQSIITRLELSPSSLMAWSQVIFSTAFPGRFCRCSHSSDSKLDSES